MNVVRENHGQAVILAVEGQVDMRTSPELRKQLQRVVRDRSPVVVADLTGVDFIDSSGLATLIEALKEVTRYGGELRLVGLGPAARNLFDLSNLTSIFQIHESREEALGANP
jgi:anti-sigma B factor antagonist